MNPNNDSERKAVPASYSTAATIRTSVRKRVTDTRAAFIGTG